MYLWHPICCTTLYKQRFTQQTATIDIYDYKLIKHVFGHHQWGKSKVVNHFRRNEKAISEVPLIRSCWYEVFKYCQGQRFIARSLSHQCAMFIPLSDGRNHDDHIVIAWDAPHLWLIQHPHDSP